MEQKSYEELDDLLAKIRLLLFKVRQSDPATADELKSLVSQLEFWLESLTVDSLKLKELEKSIANLIDLAEVHPSVDVIKRLNSREQERDAIKRELDRLYKQIKRNDIKVSEELVISTLTDMQNALGKGELEAKRGVLQKVVNRIELGRNVARIHYQFPLTHLWFKRVRGLEPLTSTLGRLRSTTELYPHHCSKL